MEHELNGKGAVKERRRPLQRKENKKITLKEKQLCKLVSVFTVIIITEYNIPSLISGSAENKYILHISSNDFRLKKKTTKKPEYKPL